jgi:hypothetical protein
MQYPFTELKEQGYYIREFSQEVPEEELVWHRDREDRIVEPLHNTDWKLQLDDELPVIIDKPIFIKRDIFHRLIKGTDSLKIKVTKLHI